jgi:hypothetical protein
MPKRLKELTERTKIEIVPTPGQGQGKMDTYINPAAPGEKAFKDKHVVQKTDYPVTQKSGSNDDIFSGAKQSRKKRLADNDQESAEAAYEGVDQEKREDIVKGMKKNKADFVSRYGKDAESVMYATANKMASEEVEEELDEDEEFITILELDDGSEIGIDDETMAVIEEVFEDLEPEHQDQFEALFTENRQTHTTLIDWVRSVQ